MSLRGARVFQGSRKKRAVLIKRNLYGNEPMKRHLPTVGFFIAAITCHAVGADEGELPSCCWAAYWNSSHGTGCFIQNINWIEKT